MSNQDHHHHHHNSEKNIKAAFFLNLFFTLVEIIGGILTNSMAVLADALHDLGDSFTLGINWYLEKVSQRARTKTFTFGFKRFSLLGALVSAVVLLVGSLFIIVKAVPRLLSAPPVQVKGILFLALLGIFINGLAAWRLKGGQKISERVVMLHLLEDVLGWVAILMVGGVMLFVDWYFLDPLLSILITLYILWRLLKNVRQTLKIFLQSAPENIDMTDILAKIRSIDGVRATHDEHVWSLDGQYNVLTIHMVVDSEVSETEIIKIKNRCRQLMSENHIQHVTIEIERETETCQLTDCKPETV
jgi:cobalt-zinc-cadmium efflux system protein